MKSKILIIAISVALLFNCKEDAKTEPVSEVSGEILKPFVLIECLKNILKMLF